MLLQVYHGAIVREEDHLPLKQWTNRHIRGQSQQLRCPYSLRSHRQEDEQTGHTQKDARDELNQGKK